MTKYLFYIIGLWLFCSCSDSTPGEEPPVTPPEPTPTITISKPEFIFGFRGENKYSYCPSALRQEDGTVHLFFCGNPENQIMVDNIFHIKINPDGSQTAPKSVLQPGIAGTWDDHHTCDPSVIEGSFYWNNTTYKYAMFFLSNMYGVYYNEIGVAFSNSLDADSWVKYPKQIVKKTWSDDGDQEIGGGGKSWGVGQPSVVSLDKKGKVLLTYTIGDIGGTRIAWAEADFSNMDNYTISTPMTIVQSGLLAIDNKSRDYTCNSEFAINQNADKIVMIRPVQPMPSDYPAYLNSSLEIDYMNLSDFMNQSGSWTPIYRITPDDTGYPRNHNATLLRDNFGHLQDWEEPTFYFTVSKAAPDVQPSGSSHAEWTYHIWKSKVMKSK
ncbi:sugar-binding protein [Bacteroides oleiciplenus]|uniref:Sugar-binding protein n=1 Tax=Bacteroides oleiciplenus TaxID=626931 RepID=A0A3E5B1V8_9BACE|nr:sugar-binding protein [Bacteroides oleiciplenus]RGN31483.1 sugar-binding protein [Bacteroides oleiciplenus]